MSEINRNNKRRNKGFTLAELLIVVAITVILATFGFVEVAANQRKLKRTEMDNIAREIFVAAQNHLTASKLNGNWLNGYYNPNGSPAVSISTTNNQDQITYTINDYPETEQQNNHAYYYVLYDKQEELLTKQKSVLTQLLPYGSLEDTIRTSASYIIEFDASTATIYGVFYTEGTFDTEDLTKINTLREDSRGRENYQKDGKRMIIGYYGGAVAQIQQSQELELPIVQINNGNVLEAIITDPNFNQALENGTKRKTKLQVTIKQLSSTLPTKNKATFTIDISNVIQGQEYNNNTVTCTDGSTNVNYFNKNTGENKIWYPEYTSDGIKYHIYLDNILGENTHFRSLFNNIPAGSDIAVEAAIIDVNGSSAIVYGSENTNANFASLTTVDSYHNPTTEETSTYEAVISNPRHLANLSQEVSAYDTNDTNFNIVSASLESDINWKNFASEDATKFDNYKRPNNGTESIGSKRFLSIQNSDIKEFKGNNHTLNDFYLLSNNDNAGLFSEVNGFEVSNLTLVDFRAYASDYVGSLIGKATNTTINNVHVYTSSKEKFGKNDDTQYQIKTNQNIGGGLVGYVSGTTSITNSSASVLVLSGSEGNPTVGGLIGAVEGTATITNCYTGGMTNDEFEYVLDKVEDANIYCKSNGNAGGLVGKTSANSNVIINDSYTTSAIYGASNGGGTSGGLVGEVGGSLTIGNVYVAGCINGDVEKTGTIAGAITNKGSLHLQANSYAYALDLVANKYTSKYVGNTNTNGLETISASALSKLDDTKAQAIPYHTELGNTYPYPSNNDKHYGDWVYPSTGTGFVYYEKYADGSIQYHGYSDEITNPLSNDTVHDYVEVGNSAFPISSTVNITEEGYLFSIPDSFFERKYDMWNHEQMDALDAIRICFNNVLYADDNNARVSLRKRLEDRSIVNVPDDLARQLGYTKSHVYMINFDSSINRIGNNWSDDHAQIDIAIGTNKNYYSIGKYFISPYYADCVSLSYDNFASRRVRTANQFYRMLEDNGRYTLTNWNKERKIVQELDIDLSNKDSITLEQFGGYLTYEGTLLQDANRYTRISGLKNTLAKNLNGGTIQNMEFSIQADGLTDKQLQVCMQDGNYGLFISSINGTLKNVKFVDCSLTNTNFENFQKVGLIATINTDKVLEDCTFENITVTGNTISNNVFGIVASTSGTILRNTFKKITIQDNTFSGKYFGVIGEATYNNSIQTSTFDTIVMNNNTMDGNELSCGVIAKEVRFIQDSTFSHLTLEGNVFTGKYFGILGDCSNNVEITGSTFDGMTLQDNQITATSVGFIANLGGFIKNSTKNTTITNMHVYNTDASKTITCNSLGVVNNMDYNSSLDGVEISSIQFEDLSLSTPYYGVIVNSNGTVKNTKIHDIVMQRIDSSKNANSNEYSYGVIVKNRDLNHVEIYNVDFNNNKLPEGNVTVGVLTLISGNSTSVNIHDIKFHDFKLNGDSMSVIPMMNHAFTTTNISNIEMKNLNVTCNTVGVVGSITSSVDGLTIDGVQMCETNTSSVNAKKFGIVASIDSNYQSVNHIVIGSVDLPNHIYALTGSVETFGVVGEVRSGTVNDLKVMNTTVEDLDFSSSVNDNCNTYVYGIVGYNSGSINNILLQNTTLNDVILPIVSENMKMYVGVVGYHCNGSISGSEVSSENITITNISQYNLDTTDVLDDVVSYDMYGFVGCNAATMKNINVVDYVSTSNNFVYENRNGRVENCYMNGSVVSY